MKLIKENLGENKREVTTEYLNSEFPIITDNEISGLLIRAEVPNMGSIESSLLNYKILSGIRSADFPIVNNKYYSLDEERRVKKLVNEINENQEINPLIIVVDADDVYILEGLHRYYALQELGIRKFPAKIVVDLDLVEIK